MPRQNRVAGVPPGFVPWLLPISLVGMGLTLKALGFDRTIDTSGGLPSLPHTALSAYRNQGATLVVPLGCRGVLARSMHFQTIETWEWRNGFPPGLGGSFYDATHSGGWGALWYSPDFYLLSMAQWREACSTDSNWNNTVFDHGVPPNWTARSIGDELPTGPTGYDDKTKTFSGVLDWGYRPVLDPGGYVVYMKGRRVGMGSNGDGTFSGFTITTGLGAAIGSGDGGIDLSGINGTGPFKISSSNRGCRQNGGC